MMSFSGRREVNSNHFIFSLDSTTPGEVAKPLLLFKNNHLFALQNTLLQTVQTEK